RGASEDAPEGRTLPRSFGSSKEGGVRYSDYRYHERAIKIVVAHFARGFRDQCTAMACGAVQPPAFHALARGVLSADRIVRAQSPRSQRVVEVGFNVSCLLHQAS